MPDIKSYFYKPDGTPLKQGEVLRNPELGKTFRAIAAGGAKAFYSGPLAFAGGSTVELSDYRAANPTGVPAELASADAVKRGQYLARAADCMVCHTAPGGKPYAGVSRSRARID
jgi:mono/diheme cytochrome c family protein